jgi:hypothetical protein
VGRATGRLVADEAWEKAQSFIKGKSEDDFKDESENDKESGEDQE